MEKSLQHKRTFLFIDCPHQHSSRKIRRTITMLTIITIETIVTMIAAVEITIISIRR